MIQNHIELYMYKIRTRLRKMYEEAAPDKHFHKSTYFMCACYVYLHTHTNIDTEQLLSVTEPHMMRIFFSNTRKRGKKSVENEIENVQTLRTHSIFPINEMFVLFLKF